MLFFYRRVLLIAISAIVLIQFTVARPVFRIEDNALVERTEASENAPLEHQWLYPRRGQGQITKDVKANPFQPKRKPVPSPPTVGEAQPQESPNQHKASSDSAKLTLSPSARDKLDEMGLHGKARQDMIKWHKTQMKKEMRKNPLLNNGKATTGVIQQIVHDDGSDPRKKNHITAQFFNKDGDHIPNKFNGKENHHLYQKNTNGLSKGGKDALKRNNADIRDQSISHQKSHSKTQAGPFKLETKPSSPQDEQAQSERGRKSKALPNNAKLTLSPMARNELNKMGLHGKARRNMIKWHKTQIKNEMKTNPLLNNGKARTAVIQHRAHRGGRDPKEKNHITVSFLDKDGQNIRNNFNGGPNHHLYVKSTQGLSKEGKAALMRNDATIRGTSTSHQKTLSKTQTPGKSSNKGKGKQKSGKGFSKNADKGFKTGHK